MRWTERDGVFFIEGTHESFKAIAPIATELNSGFGQDQLKSLRDVKAHMARIVKETGGNCVAEFTYGQRSGFLKSLWSVDNVQWYGAGTIGTIEEGALKKEC